MNNEALAVLHLVFACLTLASVVVIMITNRRTYRRTGRIEALRDDIYEQYALIRTILERDPYILGRLREVWPQYEHMIRKIPDTGNDHENRS